MINTRVSIFKTLHRRIRELTKHGQLQPKDFKKIMMAVILNDMKEWSEYIPQEDTDRIVKLLNNIIISNDFIIDRIADDPMAYLNVNTPQTNTTWQRVWDRKSSKQSKPDKVEEDIPAVCEPWEIDPSYQEQIIYFLPVNAEGQAISDREYLEMTYGVYGQKLKTLHQKMDIYIDRETGNAWYLDNNDCTWKQVNGTGIDEDRVRELIENSSIDHVWGDENITSNILSTDAGRNQLQITTDTDLNNVLYGN